MEDMEEFCKDCADLYFSFGEMTAPQKRIYPYKGHCCACGRRSKAIYAMQLKANV